MILNEMSVNSSYSNDSIFTYSMTFDASLSVFSNFSPAGITESSTFANRARTDEKKSKQLHLIAFDSFENKCSI